MFDILESKERMSDVTQEKVKLLRDSREKLLSPGAMRSSSSRGRILTTATIRSTAIRSHTALRSTMKTTRS